MSAYSFSTDGYRNLHENFIHSSGPHMSNHPLPQPHGPSRRRPSYGGYQPSHGSSSHWNGAVKPGRFRGDSRRFQPSYRPRDHHTDHSESGYDNDKPRFGWGANYSHSQGYDPPPASLSRRDIMAERMFEPSESWKHDHVPDSDVGIYERFPEVRNRMPPPREDYTYPYGGDSFRGPYISRRGLPPLRQPNNYRPVYPDEGRWNSSYSLDDTSNSWARQRSPSSSSRPPRGRLDYRDVSYEKSLSGSPRSSRFSSPRQSRATASRRAHSPSSSSIRSSRERSKSPPRSPERSRSSVRSSVDSRSYTAEPPVRVTVQRSHPVGQFRGRGRGNQRFGMRFPADGFRDSIAPPFAPPLPYSSPNEPRPEDRPAIHPSLPQRPSPPYLTPGPSGQPRLSERGFTGPVQSRYYDSQADRGSSIDPDATQQGNQLGKSKRKRRGGINRKKQGNQAASVGDIDDPNASPSPSDGLGSVVSHIASPVDEVKASVDLSFPVLSEAQAAAFAAMEEIPRLTLPGPEIEPPSAAKNEVIQVPPSTALVSEGFSNRKSEVPAHVMADTCSPGATSQPFQGGDKGTSPVIEVITELPKLVIPPSDTPIEPPPARDDPHEVTKADSPSRSLPALSSPVPVGNTTHPLPLSEPSFGQCSPPRFPPINGLPGATASSPVSSTVPTPSLQTPSPPYMDPVVVFAAPTVQEPEDDLMPASPVSSALQAIGVPTIVRSDLDTFSANAKEAESLTEALHMVVGARQQLDVQTREERVNPILMSNRAIAPPLRDVPAPSTDTLVQEVLAGRHVEITIQAFESHVRDSLVANLASRQETVDQKIVQLRREYLTLHKEWVTRCAELDNSHRIDPAAGEVAAVPTRTTRRSAAVLGDAVRSDLEMEQIIASLGNDELYDPAHLAMRNLAVIPDMISVSRGKVDAVFDDTNNSVDDPQSFFDPSPGLAEWTDDEVEIYKQRFAKYPKQFGHIAVGLTHKTQAQCVQFYYLHKKALIDFREAITTYGQSKRRRGGRRTDKKKGGLLADIRQHDAEVSKGQDSVKRRPGAVGRRRRESARVAPRRSSTAVQQEEQTPVTTPTPEPEPEPVRPKRRRNPRPAPEPEPGSVGTGTGTEEPPLKRSRRGPRKPKIVPVPETSTSEPKPLSKPAIEAPSPSIEEIAGLFIAQYGQDLKRIAASLSNKTTIQVGNRFASDLEGFNLSNIAAEASEHTPLTPDPPPEDKNDSSELLLDVANGKQDRSFTIGDVPPMSATSRSHLIDLQSLPFSIPGSSTGSTLRLYS